MSVLSAVSEDLIPDVPEDGPFAEFRRKASFNWKKLKLYIEGEKRLQFKKRVKDILESDPIFKTLSDDVSSEEKKSKTVELCDRLLKYELCQRSEDILQLTTTAAELGLYDLSLATKRFVAFECFLIALRGEIDEFEDILEHSIRDNVSGCIAMTEVGGGSNLQALKTTAFYYQRTQEFVLNSPSFESWKCWIGNLGRSACQAVVFAQLYTPDGECHGIHIFLVPIRDPKTMKPLSGVTVGDVGPKLGVNGIDNGFLAFRNVRIPRKNLLSRVSQVTADGKFITRVANFRKRFAEILQPLNFMRFTQFSYSVNCVSKAVTIAVRYAAVRKQFGPPNGEEVPILEYQLHQWRILPYLSAWFVLSTFVDPLLEAFAEYNRNKQSIEDGQQQLNAAFDLHTVMSAAKPFFTWMVRDVVQECREACGAFGYLKDAGISELLTDSNVIVTWEGDNNVLPQQTANNLIYVLQQQKAGYSLKSPMGIYEYLEDIDQILKTTCNDGDAEKLTTPEGLMTAYEWLVAYSLNECYNEWERELKGGKDLFTVRNDTQVFFCRPLVTSFTENMLIRQYFKKLRQLPPPEDCASILVKLGMYFGLWKLESHLTTLQEGCYFETPKPIRVIRKAILELGIEIKDQAISLVDVMAPSDFYLRSILGNADGEVYKHVAKSLFTRNMKMAAKTGSLDGFQNLNLESSTRKSKL